MSHSPFSIPLVIADGSVVVVLFERRSRVRRQPFRLLALSSKRFFHVESSAPVTSALRTFTYPNASTVERRKLLENANAGIKRQKLVQWPGAGCTPDHCLGWPALPALVFCSVLFCFSCVSPHCLSCSAVLFLTTFRGSRW